MLKLNISKNILKLNTKSRDRYDLGQKGKRYSNNQWHTKMEDLGDAFVQVLA